MIWKQILNLEKYNHADELYQLLENAEKSSIFQEETDQIQERVSTILCCRKNQIVFDTEDVNRKTFALIKRYNKVSIDFSAPQFVVGSLTYHEKVTSIHDFIVTRLFVWLVVSV